MSELDLTRPGALCLVSSNRVHLEVIDTFTRHITVSWFTDVKPSLLWVKNKADHKIDYDYVELLLPW